MPPSRTLPGAAPHPALPHPLFLDPPLERREWDGSQILFLGYYRSYRAKQTKSTNTIVKHTRVVYRPTCSWCMATCTLRAQIHKSFTSRSSSRNHSIVKNKEFSRRYPCKCRLYRPVGWSGDGGVRESNKVELIKSGEGA